MDGIIHPQWIMLGLIIREWELMVRNKIHSMREKFKMMRKKLSLMRVAMIGRALGLMVIKRRIS